VIYDNAMFRNKKIKKKKKKKNSAFHLKFNCIILSKYYKLIKINIIKIKWIIKLFKNENNIINYI